MFHATQGFLIFDHIIFDPVDKAHCYQQQPVFCQAKRKLTSVNGLDEVEDE